MPRYEGADMKGIWSMLANLSEGDLRLLRVFAKVVEAGGFSAAQIELNVSQSTISTHMTALEQRLGVRLCERGRAGFQPHRKGQADLPGEPAPVFGGGRVPLGSRRRRVAVLVGHAVASASSTISSPILACRLHEAISRFNLKRPRKCRSRCR